MLTLVMELTLENLINEKKEIEDKIFTMLKDFKSKYQIKDVDILLCKQELNLHYSTLNDKHITSVKLEVKI